MLCLMCCFSAAELSQCCRVMSSEHVLFNRFNQRIITTNEWFYTHTHTFDLKNTMMTNCTHWAICRSDTSALFPNVVGGPHEAPLRAAWGPSHNKTHNGDAEIQNRMRESFEEELIALLERDFLCFGWVNLRKNQKHKKTHFQSWAD